MSLPGFSLELVPAELVSARAFADQLGLSESGLRYMVARGRLPEPVRIGGRCYWPRDVAAFHVAQRSGRIETAPPMETGR